MLEELSADTPRDRRQGLDKRTDGKELAKGSISNHRAIKDSVKDTLWITYPEYFEGVSFMKG